jgi:hypothetical protein
LEGDERHVAYAKNPEEESKLTEAGSEYGSLQPKKTVLLYTGNANEENSIIRAPVV